MSDLIKGEAPENLLRMFGLNRVLDLILKIMDRGYGENENDNNGIRQVGSEKNKRNKRMEKCVSEMP